MSTKIEFGTKALADQYREDYGEHLCSDDDARLKTVEFASDTPEHVIEQARLDAQESRGEQESGPGQVPVGDLSDRFDFSREGINIPKLRSVKGIAMDKGVNDWLAYFDPTLTVDEHREVYERARREQRGTKRLDEEETVDEKLERASKAAQSDQCDHAEDHCRNGDPDACEFLENVCGFDSEMVDRMLSEDSRSTSEETEQQPLSGKEAGAHARAKTGYRSAVASLRQLSDEIRKQRRFAEQAWSAMRSIREQNGMEVEPPRVLHEVLESIGEIPDEHRLSTLHEHFDQDVNDQDDAGDVVEKNKQRDLEGDRRPQSRLAGGEQGERGQGEVVDQTEENPGGIMADEREDVDAPTGETEQQIPDEFRVAEGGQRTL